MIDSISEQLEREMACEALLSCFYDHTELDKECYQQIASSSEPLTVDDVAEKNQLWPLNGVSIYSAATQNRAYRRRTDKLR